MTDIGQFQERVSAAAAGATPLAVQGNATRAFYGRAVDAEPLDMSAYRGTIDYSPPELVLSARAGTPLQQIEETLAAEHQMLAFEPPAFGPAATLGGTIACGLSGPRRPWAGAAQASVPATWTRPFGLLRPVDEIAQLTRRYMHETGATRDQLFGKSLIG